MNDPHAVTYHDGGYDLFFQHVPDGTTWAAHCHWGRATSTDLVSWVEQPVALRPAPDEAGCWSGCLVTGATGEPVIFYTSVLEDQLDLGRVRVARRAGDGWARWSP